MRKLLFILMLCCSSFAQASIHQDKVSLYFNTIKNNPCELQMFLQAMPKGGDVHNHLAGATYAECLLEYGKNGGWCIDSRTFALRKEQSCKEEYKLDHIVNDKILYNKTIDAWSMRSFVSNDRETRQEHFFNTFEKFLPITQHAQGEESAEVASRAGRQNVLYLELIIVPHLEEVLELANQATWSDSFDQMREELLQKEAKKRVSEIKEKIDRYDAIRQDRLNCHTDKPDVGCGVMVRYQYAALRALSPVEVFTQLLIGFELAQEDHRVVAVNLVQPEHDPISVRDYELHMQMFQFFHRLYPDVHISLHAGELVQGLVPPSVLKDHINKAIHIGCAERIGHGVSIAYEEESETLLKEMKAKHIMVETNLTSNRDVLNLSGDEHPLPFYVARGVPVTLSTDDEGVSRSDLTQEYKRAVEQYHFDYLTLKKFARNSVSYSFISGENLWKDRDYFLPISSCQGDRLGSSHLSLLCRRFLKKSEKASLQWKLEEQFNQFERKYAKL